MAVMGFMYTGAVCRDAESSDGRSKCPLSPEKATYKIWC